MRARFDRLAGLIARYRIDRRLPPQVLGVYRDVERLRRRTATDRLIAARRPVLGRRPKESTAAHDVYWRQHRVVTNGPIDRSMHQLGLDNAELVSGALAPSAPFLVDRSGDGFVFGIRVEQRATALAALVEGLSADCWLLAWSDGRKSGVLDLAAATHDRRAARARNWRLFRPYASGTHVLGADSAVVLEFWDLGSSGQLELVGTRGHHRFDVDSCSTVEEIDGVALPGRHAFPVGRDLRYFDQSVDIVFTWVDGADPNWRAEFAATASRCGRSLDEAALSTARYRSRDELRYALRSVWAYCGWARRIFIVTSGQVPTWLLTDERIRIVEHAEILPADALPTFNSHAIESALHRIDGLAEHFVYFNDDMFVGRPLRPEHFFTSNGLIKVFSSGAPVRTADDAVLGADDTGAKRGRELLLHRFGRVVVDKPMHSPYPLRRSVLEAIDRAYPDIVGRTSRSQFRSHGDLSIAASFAMHYAVASGEGVFGEIEADYVHVESKRLKLHLERIRLGRGFDTFCLNETGLPVRDVDRVERQLDRFFTDLFPVAAPWERPS